MPNIKPVSDLRNYAEILRDVDNGATVFLTKNGRGKYALLTIEEYEKLVATLELMNALAQGEKSGEEAGWISSQEVKSHFAKRYNEPRD